jgi:hypothetical protein
MLIIAWLILGLIAGFIAGRIVNKAGEGLILGLTPVSWSVERLGSDYLI